MVKVKSKIKHACLASSYDNPIYAIVKKLTYKINLSLFFQTTHPVQPPLPTEWVPTNYFTSSFSLLWMHFVSWYKLIISATFVKWCSAGKQSRRIMSESSTTMSLVSMFASGCPKTKHEMKSKLCDSNFSRADSLHTDFIQIHGNFEIILINLKSATVFILKMLQKYIRKNLCCMFFIFCASLFGDFLHLFLFHTFISHFLANLSVHSSQGAQKNTSYTSYIYPGGEGDI